MEVADLHLPEQKFTSAPTKTQLTNLLRDVSDFLSSVGASLIMDRSYSLADNPVGILLNAAIQIKAAAKGFEDGPNAAGLAVPQPVPGQVRR